MPALQRKSFGNDAAGFLQVGCPTNSIKALKKTPSIPSLAFI